jgi:hypothetical protein
MVLFSAILFPQGVFGSCCEIVSADWKDNKKKEQQNVLQKISMKLEILLNEPKTSLHLNK